MTTGTSNLYTMTDSSLCSLCSTQLVLDEVSAGGIVLKEDGNVPVLYFPHVEEMEEKFPYCDSSETEDSPKCWEGRSAYEREVTPPDLPELTPSLPDGCRFCLTLKEALLHRYKKSSWWETTTIKLKIEARYRWCGPKYGGDERKGGHAFRLSSLTVTYSHPNLENAASEYRVDRYPIMADSGKWVASLLSCIGVLGAYSSASRSL